MSIKRSVALAVSAFPTLADAGTRAERAGFDRAWTTELRSRDAVARAQHVGSHTSSLLVGTGIAYAFTRHPMAMVAAAVEASAAVGGRLTLGIGAGTDHTRGEFGIEFDHPATRLAEYLAVMRAALDSDGGLEHHGRFYDVSMPGFAFGHPRELLDGVRLYAAALMPTALRLLSREADGIALHPFGHVERYLDQVVLPVSEEAAGSVGRTGPSIAAWMVSCALEDGEEARALARAQIALYAAQPGFAAFFEHTPWAGCAASVRARVDLVRGRVPWRELGSELVPDEMLDGLAAAGTPEEVVEAVVAKERQLSRQGVDELTLQVPGIALPAERTDAVLDGLVDALAR
ncbi:LLM class flavin-dependent oxidoreductase [Nocardioides mangrovi]|uniref:LLM class flavin-dependent oxidoreductase n=1 Tax=Nocardioides mangrovi TaxID=2874580 RepID=A0ABS7UFD1_9ACTN|nr:LLM class flavin-dependent oxidoreductase [Nocardioides mangrovi]MBZ5739559.1 LLM class flavin-dependent oxidoreductase [Nocardioides mangrovi]